MQSAKVRVNSKLKDKSSEDSKTTTHPHSSTELTEVVMETLPDKNSLISSAITVSVILKPEKPKYSSTSLMVMEMVSLT